MAAITTIEAAGKLAQVVEKAKPSVLAEIVAELFPEKSPSFPAVASEIARHVRDGLEPEEIVDLWNVVFPDDRNVWYNEEDNAIHYNEELVGHTD